MRTWLAHQNRLRRERRLLARLARAERLRALGRLTAMDYSVIAVGVLVQLDEQSPSDRADRFQGKSWDVGALLIRSAAAIAALGRGRNFGAYADAPDEVARHVPGVARRLSDGAGGWSGVDASVLTWTPKLTSMVAEANRRASAPHAALSFVEARVARFHKHYPYVFLMTGAVLGMILTGVVGFLLGQGGEGGAPCP